MTRSLTNGFLPTTDPLISLPAPFDAWEAVGRDLSKLALTRHIRPIINDLPPLPSELLHTPAELERAMSLLSYMANLYLWAPDHPIVNRLPANLARGWVAVARRVHRPPVLTYASQTIYNWRRIKTDEPIEVGNLTLVQNFLGGQDEEWFVTIHTTIEAASAPALQALDPLQKAAARQDANSCTDLLHEISTVLQTIHHLLQRMPERCDPDIYYHRVRPYMFGWKDNPLLPDGLIYEGVDAFGGRPVEFRGETGAQSSIIPAIDAALGISHEHDAMRAYLNEMREYMPRQDRDFITHLERSMTIRPFVEANRGRFPTLREAYNAAIDALAAFRQLHIEFAALYILKPARQQTAVGTGGTPFTVYLKKHIRETEAHRI
ncbi:MAG: hypothetical protein QNJ45_05140 [Ardenticatenaceae bacterium]|nr:hypothetical protein [Ardenticatenaceae bacterium]